jgi:hypothetical protein
MGMFSNSIRNKKSITMVIWTMTLNVVYIAKVHLGLHIEFFGKYFRVGRITIFF